MSAGFAEFHDELRSVAREVLSKRSPSASGGDPPSPADWSLLADSGWVGLEVPDDAGGAGATFAEVAVVLHEMGRAATASSYLGSAVMAVGALNLLEAGPGRDDLLASVASGNQKVAVVLPAAEEAGTGAAPFRMESTAGRTVLVGEAPFVPDAADADTLLVAAAHPELGTVAVPVPKAAQGLHVEPQPVVDATRRLAVVRADGVDAADTAPLPFRPGGRDPLLTLSARGALAVACDSLGVAEAMLEATVSYAGARQQFGRPIGSFQAVKHACADMLVKVRVGGELLAEAVTAVAEDDPRAAVAASMAKSYVSEAAVEVAGKAMQLHGGIGYTWESGIHVYLKRALLNRSLFGSPASHRRLLARRYD